MQIVRIGRTEGNVIIGNDNEVSRKHCEIIKDDSGNFRLIDYSKNGTMVNGVRRSGEVRLSSNDIVQVGNTVLPWQSYFSKTTNYVNPTQAEPVRPTPPQMSPNSYMAWSIITLVLVSLLFGIIAVVFSSKVNKLWAMGDYAGAEEASRKAKTWNIVGLVLGIVKILFVVIRSVA